MSPQVEERIQSEEDNDEEPTVPDLPINTTSFGVTSSRTSGTATPTNAIGGMLNGILITAKYPNRASGSVTPVGELTEEAVAHTTRKVGSKHVRFTALASSDEDDRKSTKQKYNSYERPRKQVDSRVPSNGGIDLEAIVNEPRRKRLRTNLEIEEIVPET